MSDNFIRHLIAVLATALAGVIYMVGYSSGSKEWWWTALGLIFFYFLVHKLVDA
jgi:hypothetical protein